jgi:hypothetical protein
MKVLNYHAVNTSWCFERVSEKLRKRLVSVGKQAVIFLDLPKDYGVYLRRQEAYELLMERTGVYNLQNLRAVKPLLDFAKEQNIMIYCYRENEHSVIQEKVSLELLTLVLRAKFGKINLEEWIETIEKDLLSNRDFGEYEANFIAEMSEDFNICINLSESTAYHLRDLGFSIEEEYLYEFNRPIDKLYAMVEDFLNGKVRKDEEFLKDFESLIEKHVKFIDAVIEIGYEEACKISWVYSEGEQK